MSIIDEHRQAAKGDSRRKEAVFCVVDVHVRPSFHDLMSELLFGLLPIQGNFDIDEISAKLEAYREERRTGNDKEMKAALEAAASAVVRLLAQRTQLFIVIDQIHWCAQQWDLLQVIMNILDTAVAESCSIKVFAVAHDIYYNLHVYQRRELDKHPLIQVCTMTQKLPMP